VISVISYSLPLVISLTSLMDGKAYVRVEGDRKSLSSLRSLSAVVGWPAMTSRERGGEWGGFPTRDRASERSDPWRYRPLGPPVKDSHTACSGLIRSGAEPCGMAKR
jgi:hypothetical protein